MKHIDTPLVQPSSLRISPFGIQRIVQFAFIGAAKHTFSTIGVIASDNAPILRDAEARGEEIRPR